MKNSRCLIGVCVLVLVAMAAAGCYSFPPGGLPVTNVRWGNETWSGVIHILLPDGLAPTGAESDIRGSGFAPLTGASFNNLIPKENRSVEYAEVAVYRYATDDTNDVRLLGVPAAGNEVYLYFRFSGDHAFVQKNFHEVGQFNKKLQAP